MGVLTAQKNEVNGVEKKLCKGKGGHIYLRKVRRMLFDILIPHHLSVVCSVFILINE